MAVICIVAKAAPNDQNAQLPKCDTPENLNTLWPNCLNPKEFCVCRAKNEWICLPCPKVTDQFIFESQMCETKKEETTTKSPQMCSSTLLKKSDAVSLQKDTYSLITTNKPVPTPPTRGPFILPTPPIRKSQELLRQPTIVPSPPTRSLTPKNGNLETHPTAPTQLPFVYKLKTAVPTPPRRLDTV